MIRNYNDFISELLEIGFSGAVGGKDDGVFRIFKYGWGADEGNGVEWHTGDPQTDPWEWRMRILDERDDIAYSKVFFRKAGYITKEWYPYFIAARRRNKTFEDEYLDGVISNSAKRIYSAVAGSGSLPSHEIKRRAAFSKEEKSNFDGALTELQMKLYLTMCGRQPKFSKKGEEYGWSSMVFCTTESFWSGDVFKKAAEITTSEAVEKISERILRLNPLAQEKKIVKFIKG